MGVFVDEAPVEDAGAPDLQRLPVGCDERLAHPGDRREIATGLDLMVLGRDLSGVACRHLHHRLRVGEPLQSALAQGVEGDDRNPAFPRLLQLVQHTGRVRADILAEEQNQVGRLEIVQHHRPDGDADRCLQPDGRRLVAHVGRIGQVVVAVHPGEEPVDVGRLQRGAARRVEHHRFRIEGAQFPAYRRRRLLPGDRHVTIARRVVAHRMREPALPLQGVIRPAAEFRHRVLGEEVGSAALGRLLPGRRLRAVLAIFERPAAWRAWPRRRTRT